MQYTKPAIWNSKLLYLIESQFLEYYYLADQNMKIQFLMQKLKIDKTPEK